MHIWRAGAAAEPIELPLGHPLAGYFDRRDWSKPADAPQFTYGATGTLDALRAKALTLAEGDRRVALVSMDLVGISPALREAVDAALRPLGFGPTDYILTATHTHSGPGGFTRSEFFAQVGADRFRPETVAGLGAAAGRAVGRALASMRPASCRIGVATLPEVFNDRRGHDEVDRELILFHWLDERGETIAAQIHVACHPTVLGADNLRWSSDLAGAAERAVERALGGVAIQLASPCGNVVPREEDGDAAVLARLGAEIAGTAAEAARAAEPAALGELALLSTMPPAPPVAVREDQIPGPLGELLGPGVRQLREGISMLAVGVQAIRIGGWVLATLPGEVTVGMGRRIRAAVEKAAGARAALVSYTNGHLGYMTTPEEYAEGGYEALLNLCGGETGPVFQESLAKLVARLPR